MVNLIQSYQSQIQPNLQISQTKPQTIAAPVENSSVKTGNTQNIYHGKDLVNNTNSIKDLDEIFKKLDGKEGKEFADTAYAELVKYFGLEGIAPKSITWEKNEGRPIIGDFRFYDNSVVFYTDYFMQNDKATQLGTIAHELTHCKQLANMLTTEGIPVEKIAYAYAVSDMRAMLVKNPQFIAKYKEAKAQGKEKEFIQISTQQWAIKTAKELYTAHSETLKLPKHPLNSPEGIKAQKDLVAQFNYNGADLKAYNACPLEHEAMAVEKMVSSAYKSRQYGTTRFDA